jgi:hypothetical protein
LEQLGTFRIFSEIPDNLFSRRGDLVPSKDELNADALFSNYLEFPEEFTSFSLFSTTEREKFVKEFESTELNFFRELQDLYGLL